MFGPFRATMVDMGSLLWKRPWRLSRSQKFRQRKRLQQVDENIQNLYDGMKSNGMSAKSVDHLMFEFPKEKDMDPKDKYTVFDKHSKGYRKAVHFVPKWTKVSLRKNPKNF